MRYLLAILIPPLAILLCGKMLQAVLNLVIWIGGGFLIVVGVGFLIVPIAMLHAILVVNSHLADKRNTKLMDAVKSSRS